MKALWIRIEAHEIDSVEVARFAELLELDVVTAFGHYCALGGAIAEHAPEGDIADVPNSAIERWGRWVGKRGRFAAAVRDVFQSEGGVFADWLESMGKLVERREKERARWKLRGGSAETPHSLRGDSGATERNGTERYRDLSKESSNTRSGISDDSTVSAAAPPADATFADVGKRFLATFYRGASAKRLADVRRQIFATLDAGGAKLKDQRVRAGSEARLVAKMREVIAEGVNDADKAIVVLLLKLGDTSDGSAPGVAAAAAVEREERATEADIAAAKQWVLDHQDVLDRINAQIDRDVPGNFDEMHQSLRAMAYSSLVVKAWRDRPPNKQPPDGGRPHTD